MSTRRVEMELSVEATPSLAWVVEGASIRERLNEPYRAEVDVRCADPEADPMRLLGSDCQLKLARAGGERFFSGIVSRVEAMHPEQGEVWAHLLIEPALAALRHTEDSRIFQEKSVPEILEEVLKAGLAPYRREARKDLRGSYPKREYTLQHQESAYEFVHRLMEEEGILYVFEQAEGGREALLLFDHKSQHRPVEGSSGAALAFANVESEHAASEKEYIRAFAPRAQLRPTKVTVRDYDWSRPGTELEGAEPSSPPAADPDAPPHGARLGPARELYGHGAPRTIGGYAGERYQESDVARQAKLRREVTERDALFYEGRGTAIGCAAGRKFELQEHPLLELNAEHVLLSVEHRYRVSFDEETGGAEAEYDNQFLAIPAEVQWRPARLRARPRIPGLQSATVVGPAGEEIHTDVHGRVKVRFHWDRAASGDEKSSCWIRVLSSWAGSGFGAMILPRVGMEVAVAFLDGDPDRPIVAGCLYNGDHRPPLTLPEEKTRSTLKSRTSPGGEGFNELRFEDKKGEEEVYLHAQRDLVEHIEHDRFESIEHDQTNTIGNDLEESIGHDRAHRVTRDDKSEVGRDEAHRVGRHRTVEVVGSHYTVIAGKEPIEKNNRKVKGSWLVVQEDYRVEATKSITSSAPEQVRLVSAKAGKAGSQILLTPDQIELKCGGSSLLLKADGSVTLQANQKATLVSPGSQIEISRTEISSTSSQIKSQAIGLHEILGALIKIN